MASPDGLRLYFGNRLPPDVADLIFAYGFHLWLAKPVDFVANSDYDGVPVRVYTTRNMALERSLSERACKLVNYDRYEWAFFKSNQYEFFQMGYARPWVWHGLFEWMPMDRRQEEWLAIPDFPAAFYAHTMDGPEWPDYEPDAGPWDSEYDLSDDDL